MTTSPHTATKIKLGIVSALHEEQDGIVAAMQDVQIVERGMRSYMCGKLWGVECVCVLARIGKVGAATTTTMLIAEFGVTHVVFTGVAGGAADHIKVGDIVVAHDLIQHDMDASPLFPRYEIPLTEQTRFFGDPFLSDLLARACQGFLHEEFADSISLEDKAAFALDAPTLHQGLIASGDQFIHERAVLQQIKRNWPDLLAVEMEGAAVAQVCYEFSVPFAVMRTISDGSNEESARDFSRFIEKVAARYAFAIARRFCALLVT